MAKKKGKTKRTTKKKGWWGTVSADGVIDGPYPPSKKRKKKR